MPLKPLLGIMPIFLWSALLAGAEPSSHFQVYLLFGQSNMAGMPKPEAQDTVTNPRVKVLAYDSCSNTGHSYNQWYTAKPPLHGCREGVGPGNYFGKMLADSFPTDTIGLVPCGISGVDIDFFRKNVVSKRRGQFRIPPDNHWTGGYPWVVERVRLAQQRGVLRGMIFHQGESDNGNPAWIGKVKEIVADLRADLGVSDTVPFIAAELLYTGCCKAHNRLIDTLPFVISNCDTISTADLAGQDGAHFNLASQRILGKRYALKMIKAMKR
jgi:hypothetical protein